LMCISDRGWAMGEGAGAVTPGTAEADAGPPAATGTTWAGDPGRAPVVVMRGVGKRFGDFQAVQGLDLTVPEGGLVALIGPSGCGKTTTVRLLLGVYQPSEGACSVFGQPSYHIRRAVRERIGYLPQDFVLYQMLTVQENLGFAAATYGLGPFRRRRQIAAQLDLVGLAEHRKTLARDLSGGMRRRLMLAATLLHEPDLLFLDEPTAGIDPILREQLWQAFRAQQAAGHTLVVTTQYVAEAEYCDAVVLMDRGAIVAHGTPEALRQQAAGGALLDVTIPDLYTFLAPLGDIPGVLDVLPRSREQVRLRVEDARAVIPQVTAAVQAAGGTVAAIEERRLSFNEVFVALLERAGRDVGAVRGNVE
jgi:ABC-2 type transport system ATP-binding protein